METRSENRSRKREKVLFFGYTGVALAALILSPNSTVAQEASASALGLGEGENADDAVRRTVLTARKIPKNVSEVRERLESDLRGQVSYHSVANGGHENPSRRGVMFMVFGTYSGPRARGKGVKEHELFIGFFIRPKSSNSNQLVVHESFMELIAWDRMKRVYNFWELIKGKWHYRGDSNDVLSDIATINVSADSPKFPAKAMRCSACHTLGGPIMKEINAPHNDWWTKQGKLELGKFKPDASVVELFQGASDASNLSKHVKVGIDELINARAGQAGPSLTLKQRMRSLFMAMEMNLVTDTVPFKERKKRHELVEIPLSFFVDSRLLDGSQKAVRVNVELYEKALMKVGSRFTNELRETHHAFNVPARSYIDNQIVDSLIKQGMLDDELVADVLSVDLTTPVYSRDRSSLIKFVPESAKTADEVRKGLIDALGKEPPTNVAAKQLLANLTDAKRTAAFHRNRAVEYLGVCRQEATTLDAVVDWLKVASQRRREVMASETSSSPQGNILERGFREVFPTDVLRSQPGKLRLDPSTARATSR